MYTPHVARVLSTITCLMHCIMSAAIDQSNVPLLVKDTLRASTDQGMQQTPVLIHVIAWRRRASLARLLRSLAAAEYDGFRVNMSVSIDGDAHPLVVKTAHLFPWSHGEKHVFAHTKRRGLEKAVMDAWDPASDNELAFFFEDDTEVSTQYFVHAMRVMDTAARTADRNLAGRMVGVALNTPRLNEVLNPLRLWTPDNLAFNAGCENAYIMQLPCSWGALYIGAWWRRFRSYYAWRTTAGRISQLDAEAVPHSRTNTHWPRSWKRYLVEYMVLRGLHMHYPRYAAQASLSTHHREAGEHTGHSDMSLSVDGLSAKDNPLFTVPLLQDSSASTGRQCTLDRLPIVSFYHEQVRTTGDLCAAGEYTALLAERAGWREEGVMCQRAPIEKGLECGSGTQHRYMTYFSSGSLKDQLRALENASMMAKESKRTLLVPPLFFSETPGALPMDTIVALPAGSITWDDYVSRSTVYPTLSAVLVWPEAGGLDRPLSNLPSPAAALLAAYGLTVSHEERHYVYTLEGLAACAHDAPLVMYGQLSDVYSRYMGTDGEPMIKSKKESNASERTLPIAPSLRNLRNAVCGEKTEMALCAAAVRQVHNLEAVPCAQLATLLHKSVCAPSV